VFRVVDWLSIALLLGAILAFSLGIVALSGTRDLEALYWLVVGALALRGAVDLVRPRPGVH
jgi:hypothetical protein